MAYEALDFYDVDSLLSEEERMVRDMVRDWVDEEVIPNIDVLSLGGSRTVDGGVGLMSSLGIEFYIEENIITNPKPRDFKDITAVKIADSFAKLELRVLTDTSIPLLGSNSAIATYGPQKGLNKKDIKYLEEQLERIYDILSLELGIPLDPFKKDTGAAGGLSLP